MQTVIIVVHLMIVLALVGLVLLQKSEGGGLGMGGSSGGFMSSRGTANVLSRATAVLAGLFFVTSLVLSILAGVDRKPRSILDGSTPATGQPSVPSPIGGGSGGVLDRLQGPPAGAPAPQTPSGPQVPQSR